ncbi:hypothetical protein [Flaviramulus aquimarinus]|uniref:hypothetical protein n=1 Tax=Flaviramulus aquimarinus TaxID=1170456 RepID=UPI0031E82D0E
MPTKITSTLFCATYGHNYFRLSEANENTPELICKCCKNYFEFNKIGDIVYASQKQNESYSFLQNLSA